LKDLWQSVGLPHMNNPLPPLSNLGPDTPDKEHNPSQLDHILDVYT